MKQALETRLFISIFLGPLAFVILAVGQTLPLFTQDISEGAYHDHHSSINFGHGCLPIELDNFIKLFDLISCYLFYHSRCF